MSTGLVNPLKIPNLYVVLDNDFIRKVVHDFDHFVVSSERNTFNLIIFPSDFRRCNNLLFALKAPEARLTAVKQLAPTHVVTYLKGDRMNMTSQDPKKQNL